MFGALQRNLSILFRQKMKQYLLCAHLKCANIFLGGSMKLKNYKHPEPCLWKCGYCGRQYQYFSNAAECCNEWWVEVGCINYPEVADNIRLDFELRKAYREVYKTIK